MNDNENKTNAPTIKLPVRYCPEIMSVLDAGDRETIAVLDHLSDDEAQAYGNHIVAALNEASALRAEVEGYRAMLADANRIYYEHPLRVCKTYHGDWAIYDDIGPINDERFNTALAAYAAIKPNAAAGEEGTV